MNVSTDWIPRHKQAAFGWENPEAVLRKLVVTLHYPLSDYLCLVITCISRCLELGSEIVQNSLFLIPVSFNLAHESPGLFFFFYISQEVETEQYYSMFLAELAQQGYDGVFLPKSRVRTMSSDKEKKTVDGCAIFFKKSKWVARDHWWTLSVWHPIFLRVLATVCILYMRVWIFSIIRDNLSAQNSVLMVKKKKKNLIRLS